jgi:D-beta-D-heptose 7-phosphate kinase/D-beta-D-heptose 1-phosphate adenosyltransferase
MKKVTAHEVPPHIAKQLPPDGFAGQTLLVIGDLMLDRYVEGNVDRISPEAPVPVVRVTGERATAGGAANVALNLAALRARTVIAGVVGSDIAGKTLLHILEKSSIDVNGAVVDPERPTTSKTRIMSGNYQIVRVDEERSTDLSAEIAKVLIERIGDLLKTDHINAVVLSDYAKGALVQPLLRFTIDECRRRHVPVFVDPKRNDYSIYSRATCLTPNLKEYHAAAAVMGVPHPDIATGGRILRERLDSPMLLVTQGAGGMTLITDEGAHHLAALAEEVFDVSGAGDTVIATFAAGIAAGFTPLTAAELANVAASIVVRKVGTVPILWEELAPAAGKA